MKLNQEYSKTFLSINTEIEDNIFDELVKVLDYNCAVIDIYISSYGGSMFEVDKLIHLVESNFEIINVYATGIIASAGFYLFFKINANERKLIGKTTGIYHKGKWEHTSVLGGDEDALYENKKLHMDQLNSDMEQWCRDCLLLTEEELDTMFVQNKDQFFSHDRLLQLIKNVENES